MFLGIFISNEGRVIHQGLFSDLITLYWLARREERLTRKGIRLKIENVSPMAFKREFCNAENDIMRLWDAETRN